MKANRFLVMGAVVLSTLSGCNSFNRYTLPDDAYRQQVLARMNDNQKTLDAFTAIPEVPPSVRLCPLYKQPVLPKVPEVPWRELAAIDPRDNRAMDEIQQRHIDELRQYISDVLGILRRSQEQYLKDCGISRRP